ncbi:nickel pincer cofactor biosynthesis protein LarB [Sporolactobacillus sp. CPB3-1]|uniref:Nickel pincer cofactor biosynthesis protein LarB n=1 Tax=Sporolactobacillus mangiferae TaxID=2940498 RepID=A0ABT0MF97_9BACL|nr:nickel pincer cofactor biosynthesis protein LarB [Sporolactobacillus mangiferae]MCL1632995.1 nickel pincer cofactor biosynthesis protein LarB [Sporolactobacillus mangiferae]
MKHEDLHRLLCDVACGRQSADSAERMLSGSGFTDLEFAKVDLARKQRNGYPEVIYAEGKTSSQIIGIIDAMREETVNILCTRLSSEKFAAIKAAEPDAVYYELARCALINRADVVQTDSYIAIVTAGTSDIPVAEEAAVTAEAYGNRVARVYDVGVAGIHRLFARLDVIRGAKVVIVIAGMEGALASVVGGLIDKPLIAVPTSVGYGANLKGITALLAMLNSCASGVTVVNIDNGFGAAYSASIMNHL